MSGIRGIARNLSALFSSHLIAVLQQVGLVPVFLHVYGRAGYGEWLALSAAVSYLGTLDFGVQTFVNQDLTVRYGRGEMERFHVMQSTALRLLLAITAIAAVAATVAFALNLQHLLKMDGFRGNPVVPQAVVRMAVFCLALQALTNILFGYFAGTFMVCGKAYLGAYWNNVKSLALIAAALVALLRHGSFAVVAASQLAGLWVCFGLQMFHLRRTAPDIFPTLRLWDRKLVGDILRPSGYFALIFSSNFLVYQLPVLIIERTAGAAVVTLFSVMRTIFSMTRNLLNALTQAIGPEVTRLFALGDWPALARLYDFSERIIFAVIPVANLGVLFLSPVLLTVWLKQPQLFQPGLYLFSAAISIVMSAKEHKFQFQFSTNTHRELARFMFGSYLALALLWRAVIPRFGVAGLLLCWLAVESAQLCYLLVLNARFFRGHHRPDRRFLVRLTAVSVVCLCVAAVLLPHTMHLPLPLQAGISALAGTLALLLATPLFRLLPAWKELRGLLRKRSQITTPA